MRYNYTDANGSRCLVVQFDDGHISAVPASHPRFDAMLACLRGENPDPQHVRALIDIGRSVAGHLHHLSERVTYESGTIRFDGEAIDNALSRHMVRMIRDGDQSYRSLVAFMENIAANPSGKARKQLYTWLRDRDLTITPDGCFIGYKGVRDDEGNHSVHTGRATVNGTVHVGPIPNPPGAVVQMPRAQVSDDREVGCSQGLHVGTWQYASSFGSRTLIVSVNPRDVVSVPKDCDFQKLRTCRYTVISTATTALPHTTYQHDLAS